MAEAVIEVRGLTKQYGKLTSVDHMDLTIPRGEIFGLLGPNGAGKTTTISMLVTITKPTSGTARVNGFDITRESHSVRKQVGIVFQEPSIDSILTGRENLELHGRLYGVPNPLRKQRIDELLRLVDLEKRQHDLARTYSGGMKRRLEIARGLLHQPAVLFLDEPTLGLDPATREQIWVYIRRLREERGTTIVLTTHYMEEADALCDRIGIIDHGKIVALDTPKALKASLGGDLVTLTMKSPDATRFATLPYVEKAEVKGKDLCLTVRNAPQHLAELVKLAGDVESVEVHTPTLEDVFLKTTGRQIRDTYEEGDSAADDMMRYYNNQGGR
ncbi:MAG TPA: ATP-binding cassette domain-containing protein [Candidatus Thermoplasmatota archaeon]|nr:ATP-binding cassette domain-containing protein [Candidatus Thermoplasmatota archaeon]